MYLNLRKLISEELKNFPHKIVGRLMMGNPIHTDSIAINERFLEFTWRIDNFYNQSNSSVNLGVEITVLKCDIDDKPITDSYRRAFTSNNPSGKLEKVLVEIVRQKLNRKLHTIDKNFNVSFLEFNFV
jgi:hypothetical protein